MMKKLLIASLLAIVSAPVLASGPSHLEDENVIVCLMLAREAKFESRLFEAEARSRKLTPVIIAFGKGVESGMVQTFSLTMEVSEKQAVTTLYGTMCEPHNAGFK